MKGGRKTPSEAWRNSNLNIYDRQSEHNYNSLE